MNRISEKTLLIILIALVLVFGITINSKVGHRLDSLSNQISSLTITVHNQDLQISGLYTDIDTLLKKQASIIDSYEITYGAFNSDDLIYEVLFSITPKESQADTTAVLRLGEIQREMSRIGPAFVSTIEVPVAESGTPVVTFQEGESSWSETIHERVSFRDQYLHHLKCDFGGKRTYREKELHYEGEVYVYNDISEGSADGPDRILALLNGDEIWTRDIALDAQKEVNVAFDETFAVLPGDTFVLYMEAKDVHGLTYRYLLDSVAVGGDGGIMPEYDQPDQYTVYDKDGEEIRFE